MNERLLLTDALRALEHQALASLPAGTLMARAGAALARQVAAMARSQPRAQAIEVLVGGGNNGGDALSAAMRLHELGFAVTCRALTPDAPTAADALQVHQRWVAQGGRLDSFASLPAALARAAPGGPLVIDGLFGIGLTRALTGPLADLVVTLNRARAAVVAVDVPSGLDADRGVAAGDPPGPAVRAHTTVTFIADKPGLHTGLGPALAGRVVLEDIGLGAEVDASTQPAALTGADAGASSAGAQRHGRLLTARWIETLVAPRRADSHKGSFGSVLVLGGAPGTRGAAYLAALAAQAGGAGKVWIASPEGDAFDPAYPQLMTRSFIGDDRDASVLAIGCGLGTSATARDRLNSVLGDARPCVLDADALNLIAAEPALIEALARRPGPAVLTPHPLEAARLLGSSTAAVQSDRIAGACRLAARTGAIVALKGAGTVLAAPDGRWAINTTGSAALATGGTGDVLAGLVASLMAQGYEPWLAACLGVWLHGRAGDQWHQAYPHGAGLSAVQLAASLPGAWPNARNEP